MDRTSETYRKNMQRKKRKRRRRKKRILRLLRVLSVTLLLLLVALIIWSLFFAGPRVEKLLVREAGSDLPQVSDFLKREYKDVKLISGLDETTDMHSVGEYEVVLSVNGREVTSVLRVEDTVKPVVTVKEHATASPEGAAPESMIESIEDATTTKISYEKEPDFSSTELQQVTLLVTDEGGNTTKVTTELEILFDTEPPVIEGVEELHVPLGTSVSYKRKVTVTDNVDEKVKLEVNNDGVDLNTIGDYPIVYSATDRAGNVTEVPTVLHVEKPNAENATEELVNAEADKLLAKITTEDMSPYEKAKAIFFWTHENIGYLDGTPKTNWVEGAYRGLVEHQGDCYVYFATAKCLLTRAGIKNMDIAKIPSETNHYWNLIDLGEGWYHFDTTRRKDKTYFFYTSDEELMAYSTTHQDSHNYDPELYPDIQ